MYEIRFMKTVVTVQANVNLILVSRLFLRFDLREHQEIL